jgi:hypothetical protein
MPHRPEAEGRSWASRSARWCLVACAVAAVFTGCGGNANSVATSRPGNSIPTRFPSEQTTTPGITTANGAPRVTQFQAPTAFWCLLDYANRAQVTIGWHVPSATERVVTVTKARS